MVTVLLISTLIIKQGQAPAPQPAGQPGQVPTSPPLPTKTPQELEIISKIETKTVTIKNLKFEPETLTIKLHDQVVWKNQDSIDHKVKGNDWGNVPIGPGENFTQAFDKTGTYSYTCTLHPTMTGTIIVK